MNYICNPHVDTCERPAYQIKETTSKKMQRPETFFQDQADDMKLTPHLIEKLEKGISVDVKEAQMNAHAKILRRLNPTGVIINI